MIRKVVKGYDLAITDEALNRYSAHTFGITGARWYAKMGIDCTNIALHGRWSSSAVMAYLAEAPLTSLKAKMKLTRLLSDASAHEASQSQTSHEVKNRIRASKEAVAPSDLVEEEAEFPGYVLNRMSSMVHIRKNTDEQIHNWITRCGWKWARKNHVFSSPDEPHDVQETWKKCPKCYRVKQVNHNDDDSSTSTSSSSESCSCMSGKCCPG